MVAGRVGLHQVALRQTVITEQQVVSVRRQAPLNFLGQGLDITSILVERLNKFQLQSRLEPCCHRFNLKPGGQGGGHGVVRVQRQHQYLVAALLKQARQSGFNTGQLIAHGNYYGLAGVFCQGRGYGIGFADQGRASLSPDRAVGMQCLAGAKRHDNQVDEELLSDFWQVNDQVVRQKLLQVGFDGGQFQGLRRAEVNK